MKSQTLNRATTALALFLFASLCRAQVVEQTIRANDVKQGANVLAWTADEDLVLSGFYLRLAESLPPRDEPIVADLFVRDARVGVGVVVPVFEYPLMRSTRPYNFDPLNFPPNDVGREYRRVVDPIPLRAGDEVKIVVSHCALKVDSGLVGGLQFQGRRELAKMRAPFRECRTNGPVCSIPWSEPEVVAIGSGEKFDPLCAPQNNSSVIDDSDGTLYIFCAYYSVDEQYGGGRGGSYSRIYGYKKAPNARAWEPTGLVVDLLDGQTYSGDPFVFRDLDGTPCLLFTSVDGTNGFSDWTVAKTCVLRSQTKSFAGPWNEPLVLWKDYPQYPDDNKTGGRANCVRIFPRAKTQDYLVVWNHGSKDMDIRGLVVKDLTTLITNDRISSAPKFVWNQEEGGGGFTRGDKGYYSTWQIPWLNDPNGQQRLYEIDLNGEITPESWRVVPGSIGANDGANPNRDGGTTADAWAISIANNRVWATSCEYSRTQDKNYLYARSAPIEEFDRYLAGERDPDVVFHYGAPNVDLYPETFPTVEYALGRQCSFEATIKTYGSEAYAMLVLGASDGRGCRCSVFFELSPTRARFVAQKNDDESMILAESNDATWEPGKSYRMKLVRDDAKLVGYVDGVKVVEATVDDPELLGWLNKETRFKLYGWKGGTYEISNAVLVDGKE